MDIRFPMAQNIFLREYLKKILVFIPAKKYSKYFSGTTRIYSWKSDGLSEENIKNITKSNSNFASTFANYPLLPDLNFHGHCLISNSNFIPQKEINLYIFYILNPWLINLNTDFTLYNFLF